MSQYLTAKFKIHNPSNRKREIMDTALSEYTRAYKHLLDWCEQNIQTLEEEGKYRNRYSETSIRKLLPRITQDDGFIIHSSMSDSLLVDVAGAITSYLSLKETDPATSFPICRDPSPEAYPNALEEFISVLDDENEYNQKRDILLKRSRGDVMPIYFGGADGVPRSRYFSLICEPEKSKYYGLVFLQPGRSGQRLETEGNLVRMGWPSTQPPTGPMVKFTAKSSALILPLEMGRWHKNQFIDPCLAGEANVRSAFLSRVGDEGEREYYIHIAFEFPTEAIQPETYLGVDRGIANLIALTVTDMKGKIIHQELHPGDELVAYQKHEFLTRKRLQKRGVNITGRVGIHRRNEEICHSLANVITTKAKEYKSQVVMEWLQGFKERKRDFGMLKRSPLQRIEQILEYKLAVANLPALRTVSPAYTSQDCPECGHRDRANRKAQAEFKCVNCSYEANADLNGSHNVALRWVERQSRNSTLKTA